MNVLKPRDVGSVSPTCEHDMASATVHDIGNKLARQAS